MFDVKEALVAVLARAKPLPARLVTLSDVLGLILAEDIAADMDLPPFAKALVDGYAVRASELVGSSPKLAIGEEIVAGKTPTRPLAIGEAASIMTGAPIPPEADAVVMVEKTRRDGAFVIFEESRVAPGQNVLPRAKEMKEGEVVLTSGTWLNSARLGLLASVGRCQVLVHPRPKVAIVTTGDELVEPSEKPGPGQIRNSNATLLHALAINEGAEVEVLPNAVDEMEILRGTLARALEFDVVLITGGVSAGNRDLVPAALEALGVERVFHKIRLKPGKPLWFGVGAERPAGCPGPLVFGLPGNPVSGVVGFLLFVRCALARLSAREPQSAWMISGRLTKPFRHRGDRPTYHPSRLLEANDPALIRIEPLEWAGSADLRTVARADGFAIFPEGDRDYTTDEIVGFLPLD